MDTEKNRTLCDGKFKMTGDCAKVIKTYRMRLIYLLLLAVIVLSAPIINALNKETPYSAPGNRVEKVYTLPTDIQKENQAIKIVPATEK